MKKAIIILLFIIPLTTFCQSLPGWISNPPVSNEKFYAVGVGSSIDAITAERKAKMNASVSLAEQVEPAVVTITTKLVPVLRGNKILTEKVNVTRKTVSATLNNTSTSEVFRQEEENGNHKVYVLMEMPKKEITRSLIAEIEKDKELLQALSKSKEYKKLKKEAK
jgi:hypothetical protein